MLEYTEKLSLAPATMAREDAERLRAHGLSDEEVLGVILVAGFFQLATRIADATGIELDRELRRGPEGSERPSSRLRIQLPLIVFPPCTGSFALGGVSRCPSC